MADDPNANTDDERHDIEPVREDPDRLDPHVVQGDIDEIKERVEVIATVARRSEFWSGPLPPDDRMQGYKKVDAAIVPAIMEDFTRQSIASVQAVSQQSDLEHRKLDIEDREQASRIHGDESDIRYRWASGVALWVFAGVIAVGLLIGIWKFFDNPSFSGFLGLFVIAVLLGILAVIIGGKGRLTQVESTTQVDSLNAAAKAWQAIRGGSQPTGDDVKLPDD